MPMNIVVCLSLQSSLGGLAAVLLAIKCVCVVYLKIKSCGFSI